MKTSQSHARRGALCKAPRGLWLVLAALAQAPGLQAECPPPAVDVLTEDQCQTLLRDGEFYSTYRLDDGSKDTRGVAAKLLPSTPEVVWSVITDNDDFEQFICSVARSDFDPATRINLQVIKVPFWIDVEYKIRIDNNIEGSGEETQWRSAWTYIEGGLDITEGAWTLRSHDGGTLALYEVRTDPGFGKRWAYTPSRAETELRKLFADVAARAADPAYRCP